MLSDTLHEAEREIRDYQEQYPDIYDQVQERIDHIRAEMCMLRCELDSPIGHKKLMEIDPFYKAFKGGNMEPHDRWMNAGSDPKAPDDETLMVDIFGEKEVRKWRRNQMRLTPLVLSKRLVEMSCGRLMKGLMRLR